MYSEIATLPPFVRGRPPVKIDDHRVRQAVAAGQLVVARRGVLVGSQYAAAVHPHLMATEAALVDLRGGSPAVACLGTAGLLHGIPRLGQPPRRVRLYRERGGPWRDNGVAVLVASLPPRHVTEIDGIPATTAARTAVDLARWVGFRSGVVVMDGALRLGVSREAMEAVVSDCRRWPGVRAARRAMALADHRAATPLESISRVAMHDARLPAPDLQVPLPSADDPVAVVDFFFEEFGVVGEADGMLKYDAELDPDGTALRREKLRQEALEALGYIVVRWTWDDIWRRPDWVTGRLRKACAERAGRRSA